MLARWIVESGRGRIACSSCLNPCSLFPVLIRRRSFYRNLPASSPSPILAFPSRFLAFLVWWWLFILAPSLALDTQLGKRPPPSSLTRRYLPSYARAPWMLCVHYVRKSQFPPASIWAESASGGFGGSLLKVRSVLVMPSLSSKGRRVQCGATPPVCHSIQAV